MKDQRLLWITHLNNNHESNTLIERFERRKKNVCRQHQALHKNRAWLVRRLCDLWRRHNYWTILYDDQVLPNFPYRLQVYIVLQSGEWQENVINLQGSARSTKLWALSEEGKDVGRTDSGEIGITHAVLRCPGGSHPASGGDGNAGRRDLLVQHTKQRCKRYEFWIVRRISFIITPQ